MCMIDDCEPNEFFVGKSPIAAKEHICCECGRTIARGEQYHYAVGKSDGRLWTAKQCAHCSKAAELLSEHCGGFLYGGVYEDLSDHVHEILPWSMQAARGVIGIQRKWRRFDNKGLMTI